MKLTKDQKEQLECALSELGEATKHTNWLRMRLVAKPGSPNAEDIACILGTVDLARKWIENVLRGEKLARAPKGKTLCEVFKNEKQ